MKSLIENLGKYRTQNSGLVERMPCKGELRLKVYRYKTGRTSEAQEKLIKSTT